MMKRRKKCGCLVHIKYISTIRGMKQVAEIIEHCPKHKKNGNKKKKDK